MSNYQECGSFVDHLSAMVAARVCWEHVVGWWKK